MAQQYTWPSTPVNLTSTGTVGVAAPATADLTGARDPSGNLQPIHVDASGNLLAAISGNVTVTQATGTNLHVVIDSGTISLPSGASTSALQTQISGQLPATLGAKTIANALAVSIASDQTVPVSAASLPLPSGAATSALQTQISGQLPASLGAKTTLNSLAVNIASDQTVPVSAASLPLPSGAATSALQTQISGQLPATLGAKTTANSMAVNVASDQVLPVSQSGTWNITNISGTVSLPTGAATAANQTTISGQLPASLGQKASSASMAVVIASDQSAVATKAASGRSQANAPVYNAYGTTPVTTSAYVQLVASTTSTTNQLEIYDSSGQALYLAVGGAGSEVNELIVYPGGNGRVDYSIPAGSRVSVKAITASATSGFISINFYT